VTRGKQNIRRWSLDQLPTIGEKFGFLSKPQEQKIICIYTAKGGVLKTTLSFCLARILALNGIRILIVDLDIQASVSQLALPETSVDCLENTPDIGLYHFLLENAPLDEVIRKTSLPTLDILPATSDLNMLEKKLRFENRREYIFKDKLISQLSEYDVVIFDNSPSWNQLIENALVASSCILSPAGCDLGTYKALQTNLTVLREFR